MRNVFNSCLLVFALFATLFGAYPKPAVADEQIDLSWVQRHLYTRLLPAISSIEVFELSPSPEAPAASASESFPIRPYKETRLITKKVELRGEQAQELATIWRGLTAGDTHVTCHTPLYGVRFYQESKELLGRGKHLLFETSISFECANFYVPDLYPGGGFIWFSFNVGQDQARTLKTKLEQSLRKPN